MFHQIQFLILKSIHQSNVFLWIFLYCYQANNVILLLTVNLRKICSLRLNEGFHKLPYKHYFCSPSALKYLEMKGENGNVIFFKKHSYERPLLILTFLLQVLFGPSFILVYLRVPLPLRSQLCISRVTWESRKGVGNDQFP